MGTKFEDYVQGSKRANTPEALERRAVFREAYSVAAQLLELRLKLRMTQKRLAELTGIDQAEISRIERGVVRPTDATIIRLADALNADIRLVERQPPPPRRRRSVRA